METPRKDRKVGPFPVTQIEGFPFFYEEVARAETEDGAVVRIGRHMGNQCLYVFAENRPTLALPLRPLYEALITLTLKEGD